MVLLAYETLFRAENWYACLGRLSVETRVTAENVFFYPRSFMTDLKKMILCFYEYRMFDAAYVRL